MVAARNLEIVPAQQVSIAAPVIPSLAEIDALNAMCKIAAYSGFLNSNSNNPTQRAADAFLRSTSCCQRRHTMPCVLPRSSLR